jgi:sortase A
MRHTSGRTRDQSEGRHVIGNGTENAAIRRCIMTRLRDRGWVIGLLLILSGLVVLLIAWNQPSRSSSAATASVATVAAHAGNGFGSATPTADLPIRDDLVSGVAQPNATPQPGGSPPVRLVIASIGLDAPVVEVMSHAGLVSGTAVREWSVADYAVGHHDTSADPSQGDNVVLTGHDDWRGEIFRDLNKLRKGDAILVTTADGRTHRYQVTDVLLRQIAGASLSQQLEMGKLIEPTGDERLTLVTCWPYGIDDHRLIVIARPAS